jgi:hypothetical protein
MATTAWQRWASGSRTEIGVKEAAEVFRIDSYAEGRMRTMKITRLRSLLADDADLLSFLDGIAEILEEGA